MAVGFGFGPVQRRRRGGVVPAPLAPGYLSTAVAPYAAFGAQRLVSSYPGPLYRVRRASDAAEQDVPPRIGGDYPDFAALIAWAGGASLSVPTIYDQSGNGRHLTQSTVANQPSLDPGLLWGGVAPILIDGITSAVLGQTATAKTPQVGSLTMDVIANSMFLAVAPTVSFQPCGLVEMTTEDGATQRQALFANAEAIGLRSNGVNEVSTIATNGVQPMVRTSVIGASNSATQSVIFAGGAKTTTSHTRTTTPIARLRLGTSSGGGTAYNGKFRLFGAAFYDSTVSNANGDAIVASLNIAIAVPNGWDYRIVFDGDSITEGSGSALLRNAASQLFPLLTKRAEMFNTAVHGQSLATIYANRVARFGSLFAAGRPNVIFVPAGINDIRADITGANLYANTTTPFVTYLKGLGFKVVACTLLPASDATMTAPRLSERNAYNALVVANSAGADQVLDLAGDSIMGAAGASDNTSLYVDKLHPTNAGYARLATLYRNALEQVLRVATGDAAYVA